MKSRVLSFVFCLCLLAQSEAFSQDPDSIPNPVDNNSPELNTDDTAQDSIKLLIRERPRIAATRSAIVPGLGQIYNKRWWKVPLVYGGFVGLGLVFEFNQRYYKIFLDEAQYRSLNPGKTKNPLYAVYSTEGIISVKDAYRRNRDLTILAGLGFYAIQIIDAYVDAKFFRFDVSDDLSLKVDPMIQNGPVFNASSAPVLGLKLKLAIGNNKKTNPDENSYTGIR
jgi:hypothetical protein